MAQSLRQIKTRIRSTQSTKKVTNAMQMVSATKLNRIDDMLLAIRPYVNALEASIGRIASTEQKSLHPLCIQRDLPHKHILCVITADGGLCGMYNANIIRMAETFLETHKDQDTGLILIGKRGINFFRHAGYRAVASYPGLNGHFSEKVADDIAQTLVALYLSGKADTVDIAFTQFVTSLTTRPIIKRFLPIEHVSTPDIANAYIIEPDIETLLECMLPRYLKMRMRLSILESFTSEHAARTIAMKTATDNAEELLGKLITLRNKVRQANITREMLEIISSAEALKG